jgi:nucleotide-binding universal stress UspA family protein
VNTSDEPPPPTAQSKAESGARHRIGRVLVSTDFSEESFKAIDYAVSLLKAYDGELHLVHVHEIDYSYAAPALLMTLPPVVTEGELADESRSGLTKLGEQYAIAGKAPQCHVKIGRAFDEICKVASEMGADLIVIATHGHTGLKHLLLGSTAERVVRHSPCPVLIVRELEREFAEPREGEQRSRRPPLHIRQILVPVDFSECSRRGLDYALTLAKTCGATVLLLHVVPLVPYIPSEGFVTYERGPSSELLERAAKEQMRKFVEETDFADVPHEVGIRPGRPAHEICRYSDEKHADLIVTSTHGATGLAHVLIGSTAEHVVRYAHCPVLVVPRCDEAASAESS